MDNLKFVLISALVTVVLFGAAGIVRHGSFWGASTQVQGEVNQRLGAKGPMVPLTVFTEPVPRNEAVRIFGLRVKDSFGQASGTERMARLSAAREEMKSRLVQGNP